MALDVFSLEHLYPGLPARWTLSGLSFSIDAGQFVALIGPSGCGKSTLLRLAAGLLRPSSGSILFEGIPPHQVTEGGKIAWMAQKPALLPWLTARENVALAQRYVAKEGGLINPDEALARVGLSHAGEVYPNALSGGMQQRCALARLLAMDAHLWLMDEPFAALDELTREKLSVELFHLWQPLKPAVLWVTHNIHEAIHLADRILVLTQAPGRLLGDITVNLPRPRLENSTPYQALLAELRHLLVETADTPRQEVTR
jgi:NitT/TauT family transport system ATP-binding protein